ncbi:unnamed protein product [Pleuronectes platessa]|uniref:Uncharacterized protein n=1 Tax=Pleuronectes platessa TaxID=8262 RepID=A0A9N7VK38_PLEPL|nr:unnamed protein product [Pleuronectes platessa]
MTEESEQMESAALFAHFNAGGGGCDPATPIYSVPIARQHPPAYGLLLMQNASPSPSSCLSASGKHPFNRTSSGYVSITGTVWVIAHRDNVAGHSSAYEDKQRVSKFTSDFRGVGFSSTAGRAASDKNRDLSCIGGRGVVQQPRRFGVYEVQTSEVAQFSDTVSPQQCARGSGWRKDVGKTECCTEQAVNHPSRHYHALPGPKSIHPFIHPSNHPSIHPSIHSSIRASVCPPRCAMLTQQKRPWS